MSAVELLKQRDDVFRSELLRIGQAIGYGNAQHILGELWDEMLHRAYGVSPGRGQMGVTVDDALPPVPRAAHKRRSQRAHGGYEMVPAYTVEELKAFGRSAIEYAATKEADE